MEIIDLIGCGPESDEKGFVQADNIDRGVQADIISWGVQSEILH
jgi:hypothetical protein